ncbi:MAG: hypothetical protein GF349_03260 [Candidatus Magasanikbacteria bacterium]|nr:hypothetical protein [Candidatus Magasanikbacteria bacterium]
MKKKRKLTKFQLIILGLFLLSFLIINLLQLRWPEAVIELKGEELEVLVAKTPYHLYKGLGGRESLGDKDAMLFLFRGEEKPIIVMRDMKFSIDIVWIKGNTIVDIAPNVPVEPNVSEGALKKYAPRTEANIVLEIPAGWVDENNLNIGDNIKVISE